MKPKPKFKNEQIVWVLFAVAKRIYKVKIIMYQPVSRNEFNYVIKSIENPEADLLKVSERVLFRTRRGALNKAKEIHEMVSEVIKEDEQRRR